MSNKNFQSMSELARLVHEKVSKLESGNLSAEELGGLSDELRDLYERIVVLKYKAMEKGLKIEKPTATAPVVEAKQPEVIQPMKFSVTENAQANVTPQVIAPVQPETIIPETKKPEPVVEKPVQAGIFDQPVTKKEVSVNEIASTEQKTSIAEKYAAQTKSSIAEKFASEQKMTLADKLKMTRINDLRTAIGINQKFLFMNDLFEGENTMFNNAINRLNSCNNGDEAKTVLSEYSSKYKWQQDSERVLQFYELIERRYL